ncbi:hypothetical protein KJ693_01920, partial [bacterium]|nr:hypothetical protein [bacterium]MBU1614047.1 hypothetical protein [bacterium]
MAKTPDFTCFYPKGYRWEAEQALSNLEYYRRDVARLTGNREIGNLPLVIEDVGMMINGFADPIFKNIHLFTHPPHSGMSLGITENWYREVGVHEYTHIAHLTETSGFPGALTRFFGSTFQPNLYSPGWIMEGITVFSESQASPYEGRLNDGFFDAVVRAKVSEGEFPSIHKATYSPLEFPYSGIYLYGGEFFKYLAKEYGQAKFSKFFRAMGASTLALPPLGPLFPGIGLDRAAKKTFGKSFPLLWREWQNSLDASWWKIDGEQLTKNGWWVSSPILSGQKIYYIRFYPRKTGAFERFYFEEIVERDLNTGEEKVVVSSTSEIIGGLDKAGDKLYYAVMEAKKGYANSALLGFGAYAILHERDLVRGKDRIVFEDEMRDFALVEEGRIVYARDKAHSFGSELWLWQDGKKELLASLDYLISEIISLREGRVALVARPDWQNWNIYLLDLSTKELRPIVETPFGELAISNSGEKLFFSANYEGEYAVYAYDLEGENFSKLTRTGFATSPLFDRENNDLYFVGLTSLGFDLYRKKLEGFDEFRIMDYPKSRSPLFPELRVEKGGRLDHLKTLLPKVHLVYPTKGAAGILLVGQDAVGENIYWLDFYQEEGDQEGSFSWTSTHFAPSIFSFDYKLEEEMGISWMYPLRIRLSSPLSVLAGLGLREFDGFERKEVNPSLRLALNFPKTRLGMSCDYFLEREGLGSTIDREAVEAEIFLERYIKDSQIGLELSGIYDPDEIEEQETSIRGYDRSIKGDKLAAVSLEYSRPLLKIRKGLWNPNLFFEDLCLTLFTEAAFSEEETQLSGGVELRQEAGAFFSFFRFVPTLGISFNKEEEWMV